MLLLGFICELNFVSSSVLGLLIIIIINNVLNVA